MPLHDGETILNGRYTITRLIGEGGMASVWLAEDTVRRLDVAIKEPRSGLTGSQVSEVIERFQRELRYSGALFKAEVPNVVRAITVEQWHKTPLLVMEYCGGGSLRERLLKTGPLPIDDALRITLDVLAALAVVHEKLMWVHRDIKPDNILFTEDGRTRLADFGLAQTGDSGRSMGGQPHPGTPQYMSPEQAGTNGYLAPSSDLYSVACVLFELLTGKLYKRMRPGTAASSLRKDTPAWLDHVLGKMLNDDQWQRCQSAEETAAALRAGQAANAEVRHAAEEQARREAAERAQAEAEERARREAEVHAQQETAVLARAEADARARRDAEEQALREAEARAKAQAEAEERVQKEANSQEKADADEKELRECDLSVQAETESKIRLESIAGARSDVADILQPRAAESEARAKPEEPAPHGRVGQILSWLLPLAGAGVIVWILVGATLSNLRVTQQTTPSASAAPGSMAMVRVAAGEFTMGSETGGSNDRPAHKVYLDEFWIDKTEVTNGRYRQCVEVGKCTAPLVHQADTHSSYYGNIQYDDYPVIYVLWADADAYCAWAGQRLPTEAEWEKAARGIDARIWPWGSVWDSSKANTSEGGNGEMLAVGSYPSGASPYGALDMAGNAWEWVADWLGKTYYTTAPSRNPAGPLSGQYRVIRGGDLFNNQELARSFERQGSEPSLGGNISFRCAKSSAP